MLDQIRSIPKTEFPDSMLALLREGYAFVSRQCDALRSDAFETRLMLRKVVCLRGPEATRLLYGSPHLTRVGAMPWTVLKLLQDKNSVQQLDGTPHLHRKAVFVAHLMDDGKVETLAALFRQEWLAALPQWRAQGEVDLMSASNRLFTQAAIRWTAIPDGWFRIDELATKLADMVENTGHFGPKTFATLLARRTSNAVWWHWSKTSGTAGSPFRTEPHYRPSRG
jgi:fatty-acid peroxygenase